MATFQTPPVCAGTTATSRHPIDVLAGVHQAIRGADGRRRPEPHGAIFATAGHQTAVGTHGYTQDPSRMAW